MIAHTLGNPFDLECSKSISVIKHNLWLIEDNCDALGSKYTINGEEKFTGTIGDIGTSSFYPPHHMTMGEGGAVYTNNPLLNQAASVLSATGDVTASARPVMTTSAAIVLTNSMVNFRLDMIINMYILILDTTSKQLICRQRSAVHSLKNSRLSLREEEHNFASSESSACRSIRQADPSGTACENAQPELVWFPDHLQGRRRQK